jgi:hypothetical protein
LEEWYDVEEIWRGWADDVRGRAVDCGHYLPEDLTNTFSKDADNSSPRRPLKTTDCAAFATRDETCYL